MRLPFRRSLAPRLEEQRDQSGSPGSLSLSFKQFLLWVGPALMVSIAYMDPGNYGTDLAAGAGYTYALLWAGWLASGMAMLLQYLSGKLGIASGYHLAELVKGSFGGKKRYTIPYWLAAEAAAAATDLAEYLGTVLGLNILFGIPLIYCAVFGALDVIILLTMMTRRFHLIEQYFAILISILVIGIFYDLLVIGHFDLAQVAYGSVVPQAPDSTALFIAVGMIGATVMPHALFVHSWLSKNKMDLLGTPVNGAKAPSIKDMPNKTDEIHHTYTREQKHRTNRLHRNETIIALTIAGVVNAGILLVAIPLYQGNGVNVSLTVQTFVAGMSQIYGPAIGVLFALTLLASGLSSSALGTIAGQVIMEGLIGKRLNIWIRRIITRAVNVFPTTIAILLGLSPLVLLIYSQVILSLMIPLPMIPLVYYTSKEKFMGELVNGKFTIALALVTVAMILSFNGLLLTTIV
ncbi:MAG: Nramp family divalent metal transporter [Thaumarchaeota archaeon]|nr:Nramp family divalent metal transporter [Nitrososphaerota archaeon]